nr:immunoglobulin heavy chain junction region [Macaca mulatta]MOW45477.1 immunoglobulin heavy chain junction region [Macaca mulatta]MOW45489.1 immunoglobulin heavy chain junction region [Macaca mulatta]MOW45502.1 immunoglobulin heavy chain junction region [Macaca mulatta]MOW45506.1 immunoglobulin heavy chain junction region [Macaca mulatta]
CIRDVYGSGFDYW